MKLCLILSTLAVVLALVLVAGLAGLLGRDFFQQLLVDWTGEEDLEWAFSHPPYLALGALQLAGTNLDFAPMRYTDLNPFGVNTF